MRQGKRRQLLFFINNIYRGVCCAACCSPSVPIFLTPIFRRATDED
ncbi:MAG TPA: hypothetical protein PK239_18650 [Chitinophagales bacterium]|nr:hypothetical protein [Chitinophagales bacterium]